MFNSILTLFQKQAPATPLTEIDTRHALGALLVRAAKADQVYLFTEIEQIDDVLAHRYKLTPEETTKLRLECERLDTIVPDGKTFAAILRDAIDYEERVATVLALWEVVFADGHKAAKEEKLLDQLETLLGVPTEKSKELHDLVRDAQS